MSHHADTFRRLHQGPELLLLANAWDAGSAARIASLGARAIATTSAGVAWAHGFPDGDALPIDRLEQTIRAIVRVVDLPLSVDAEGGYADDASAVGETIARIVGAGAVGVNLEDGGISPSAFAKKIAEAKRAATRAGVDLFVNARTDVYLRALVPAERRVTETLSRARIYRDAGADGLFVPKVVAADDIRAIAAEAGLPLNVLAWPGLPSVSELRALGVRRLSAGSAIAASVHAHTTTLATAFFQGNLAPMLERAAPYAEMNALFAKER